MQNNSFRRAAPTLPSHLAAACIYSRHAREQAHVAPPSGGVLAELAAMVKPR